MFGYDAMIWIRIYFNETRCSTPESPSLGRLGAECRTDGILAAAQMSVGDGDEWAGATPIARRAARGQTLRPVADLVDPPPTNRYFQNLCFS